VSDKSAIEWTEATWNPVTGCDRVSAGCDHCYAQTLAKRLKAMGNPRYQRDGDSRTSGPGFGLTLHRDQIDLPFHWRKPRRVFVNSMSDLFHDDVPDHFIAAVFRVMAEAHEHTFQVLTKRPGRMASLVPRFEHAVRPTPRGAVPPWPLPNVWCGVSVEDQHWADIRTPKLLETPAAVRFLSCEPLLGPIDLSAFMGGTCGGCGQVVRSGFITSGMYMGGHERQLSTGEALRVGYPVDPCGPVDWEGPNWVIVGGESGPDARPLHPDWARSLRDQCVAAGVPFFAKQGSGPRSGQQYDLPEDVWAYKEMPSAHT